MNIVTLYENSDLAMRKSLDRYLSQLARGSNTHIWNEEQVKAGEETEAVMHKQLEKADLVLLLISQDFLASKTCYERALKALEMSEKNPKKEIVNILLRPNSIDDTPFKNLPQLPVQNIRGHTQVGERLTLNNSPHRPKTSIPTMARNEVWVLLDYAQ